MKTLLVVGLVGFAIGFVGPAFAQEKTIILPRVRQQIEAVFMQFQEAYNNHDVDGIVSLYAEDAVDVREWQGAASGRKAVGKRFVADFAISPGKMVNKIVQLYPIGSQICAISSSDLGGTLGDFVTVYDHHADGWKIRVTYFGLYFPK